MTRDSKYYTYQQASLSQKVVFKDKIFQKLAGSDPQTSESIGFFLLLGELGYINLKEPSWVLMMGLLDVTCKAKFATSEKTNEITKLGFMSPKADDDEDWSEDESG